MIIPESFVTRVLLMLGDFLVQMFFGKEKLFWFQFILCQCDFVYSDHK